MAGDETQVTDEAIVSSAEARALGLAIELLRVETRGEIKLLSRDVAAAATLANETRRLFNESYDVMKSELSSIKSQIQEWRDEMTAAVNTHAAKDDAQFTNIAAALTLGTNTMAATTTALVDLRRDVQPVVTALTYGRKTLAVASVITKFLELAATKAGRLIIAAITVIVAAQWLWGKIPLPTWLIGLGGP